MPRLADRRGEGSTGGGGFRYGSPVPHHADGVSYTELEFLTATLVGMPRLVFLLDERAKVPSSLVDPDRNAIDGFRDRLLGAGLLVKTFTSPVDLGEAVLHAAMVPTTRAVAGMPGAEQVGAGRPGKGPPRTGLSPPAMTG
jgi:hypothetical protein